MAISSVGQSLTFAMVRRLAIAMVETFAVLFYAYGPAAMPAMHASAAARCNDHAEGNYRSFRLAWVVGVYPHWMCADASHPARSAVSLGWWSNPLQH